MTRRGLFKGAGALWLTWALGWRGIQREQEPEPVGPVVLTIVAIDWEKKIITVDGGLPSCGQATSWK